MYLSDNPCRSFLDGALDPELAVPSRTLFEKRFLELLPEPNFDVTFWTKWRKNCGIVGMEPQTIPLASSPLLDLCQYTR